MPLILAMILNAGSGPHMAAQQVAVAVPDVMAVESVVARRVSLTFDKTPLPTAIQAVATQSRLIPVYDATHFPPRRVVTVQAHDVRVDSAFRTILAGSGLTAVIRPGGTVVIVKDSVTAPQDGVIHGVVVHATTNAPIEGATVTVSGGRRTMTNTAGSFRVPVSAGEYVVAIRAIGMAKYTKTISVGAGATIDLPVTLTPGTNVLSEVVVTGTVVETERKALATPITVVTAADIEKRNITRLDQLFRGAVPGVIALDGASQRYAGAGGSDLWGGDSLGVMVTSQVYARGASSVFGEANPLKTYIDGVELMDASYLGTIDPSTIERIEIITGPQAATIYGAGAMGGVMQIFTKSGGNAGQTDLMVHLGYGVMQSNVSSTLTPVHQHRVGLQGSSGPAFSYAGNLSYLYSGQWQPALFNRSYGASASATYTRGPLTVRGSFSLTNGANGANNGTGCCTHTAQQRRVEVASGVIWLQPAVVTPFVSRSMAQTVSLNLSYRPLSWWQHSATIGRNQTRFTMDPSTPELRSASDTLYKKSIATGERNTFTYSTSMAPPRAGSVTSTMTLGANGSWGYQDRSSGCIPTQSRPALMPCFSNGTVSASQAQYDPSLGVFASWQVGVWDRLFVTFGLRGQRDPNYGRMHKTDWTPTNGIAYTIEYGELTVKLLGSYGRVTRSPSPGMTEQIMSFNANLITEDKQYISRLEAPDLRPQYSRGPQGGIEVFWGNLGSLTVNHFSQRISDQIQQVLVDSFPTLSASGFQSWAFQSQYQNIAEVTQRGWEGTGTLTIQSLSVQGTYSWADSRIIKGYFGARFGAAGRHEGMSFVGVPTHSGNLTVSYARGSTSATLTNNYIGSKPMYLSGSERRLFADYARLKMYHEVIRSFAGQYKATAYVKSDLTVMYRIGSSLTATMTMMNLGNNFGSEGNALYQANLGRQTQFGLSMRFPR